MKLPYTDEFGEEYKITLKISSYTDGSLGIAMFYYDEDYKQNMPYAALTVNLSTELEPDCAFVDTNNGGKTIMPFIEKNKLGVPTGRTKKSGFYTYPEVKFDIARIRELEKKSDTGQDVDNVIDDLECCITGECENCSFNEVTACKEYLLQKAIHTIKRYNAENEKLKGSKSTMLKSKELEEK